MKFLKCINDFIKENSVVLGGWAALVSIISMPLLLMSFILAYYQLADHLQSPDPKLSFVHPNLISYTINNDSNKIAEEVLVSFGLFDIDDEKSYQPIPIVSKSYDYVNPNSSKGPFAFLREFSQENHRYFGIVYVGCRGGAELRTYWLYVENFNQGKSFFAERIKEDTYEINMAKFKENTEGYLNSRVPQERRIYIK